MTDLLSVEGLSVRFAGAGRAVTVVDEVAFAVRQGQVFGVAGESGSGKSMSMLALMGLLPPGASVSGRALFGGRDLLSLKKSDLRRICGKEIGMVFQDPMSSLHPMLSIGQQLTDHVRQHLGVGAAAARSRAIELLAQVRIPAPSSALDAFPHQFSGGMRQRISIAIALACYPKLLIADEPTTALDVTVQAGIVRLLDRIRRESGLTIILISHNLALLSSIADTIAVFYAGRVVESGSASQVMLAPRHPYARGLLDALPHPDATREGPLIPIAGSAPTPRARPSGCAFHPRCTHAIASCRIDQPLLLDLGEGHSLACPVDPLRTA
jgi:oligopeptide transport system ATP-binding protein